VITQRDKLEGSPAPPPAAAATEPPAPAASAPREISPVSRQPAAAAQSLPGAEALWRSFLDGAGIDSALPNTPTPELLADIGTMMRITIGGIHRLVAMRALAKDEMQAQMTVIQVRGNNPLKFAPDATVALQLLLQPPARGFLGGPAALRDALIDLQSHQVGLMAGMRAALEAVLDRFDPEKLEALLAKRSVFDSLRPAHRRARLWDVYVEHYRALRGEARRISSASSARRFAKPMRLRSAASKPRTSRAPPWEAQSRRRLPVKHSRPAGRAAVGCRLAGPQRGCLAVERQGAFWCLVLSDGAGGHAAGGARRAAGRRTRARRFSQPPSGRRPRSRGAAA
jgi:hypothetical protein